MRVSGRMQRLVLASAVCVLALAGSACAPGSDDSARGTGLPEHVERLVHQARSDDAEVAESGLAGLAALGLDVIDAIVLSDVDLGKGSPDVWITRLVTRLGVDACVHRFVALRDRLGVARRADVLRMRALLGLSFGSPDLNVPPTRDARAVLETYRGAMQWGSTDAQTQRLQRMGAHPEVVEVLLEVLRHEDALEERSMMAAAAWALRTLAPEAGPGVRAELLDLVRSGKTHAAGAFGEPVADAALCAAVAEALEGKQFDWYLRPLVEVCGADARVRAGLRAWLSAASPKDTDPIGWAAEIMLAARDHESAPILREQWERMHTLLRPWRVLHASAMLGDRQALDGLVGMLRQPPKGSAKYYTALREFFLHVAAQDLIGEEVEAAGSAAAVRDGMAERVGAWLRSNGESLFFDPASGTWRLQVG
jgi:hypothetical protein